MNRILIFLTRLVILDFIFFLVFLIYMQNKQQSEPILKIPSVIPITSPTLSRSIPSIPSSPDTFTNTPTQEQNPEPAPTSTLDLFAELPKHNSQADCWMNINSHLYNITPFFGQHPAGDASLLKYCGTDATSAFNTKDKASGSPHSAAANAMLEQYLIQ